MQATGPFHWGDRAALNASPNVDTHPATPKTSALQAVDVGVHSAPQPLSAASWSPTPASVSSKPAPCSPGPVSMTAMWAAGTRYLASRNCPADFGGCDPHAEAFAGEEGLALAKAYDREKRLSFAQQGRSTDGASMYYVASRSQSIDDLVMKTLRMPDAPRCGVLLGAGLDSRAWRLEFPPNFTWYELDASKDFAKKAKLTNHGPRCAQIFAQADLSDPDWGLKALPAGLSREPTLWVAEGLVYYLKPDDLNRLVTTLTDLSAPGSVFIFDAHNLRDVPPSEANVALAAFTEFWRRRDVSYQSSCQDIEAPLAQAGWEFATNLAVPYASQIKVAKLPIREPRLHLAAV